MKTENYLPRICDAILLRKLRSGGAVLVEGAKWCGKTRTAAEVAGSVLYLQDPDNAARYKAAIDVQPSMLLEGETPRLLDEWQMYPVLWDAVRFAVDKRQALGQFILTGSAVPQDGVTMHTGTGRISRLLMRPMSLYESQDSTGEVSLKSLFDGKTDIKGLSKIDIEEIAYLICRGGWPATVSMDRNDALEVPTTYLDAVIQSDVQRVDGSGKNTGRMSVFIRSLARNISTLATAKTIIDDVSGNDITMSDKTYTSYLNVLKRIFVVEDSPAWQPSLRSKTAIRSASKRHFVDPSIGIASLKSSPSQLLHDFETFGFFFESLCTRDMRIYAQANDGEILHYRDRSGLESDMIVRLRDGRWAAVEVKLGSRQIDEAASNLLDLRAKVDTDKIGDPSFLMVLTGGEFAYCRADGVLVVPIGCLKH